MIISQNFTKIPLFWEKFRVGQNHSRIYSTICPPLEKLNCRVTKTHFIPGGGEGVRNFRTLKKTFLKNEA